MSTKRRIIMGIDPGSVITGWAIVEHSRQLGSHLQFKVIDSGSVRVPRSQPKAKRISFISSEVGNLMGKYRGKIQEVFLEDIFLRKNTKTTIALAQIQGALLAKSYQILSLNPALISPARIRKSIGMGGNATKEEVARLVRNMTGWSKGEYSLDETDAIAVALGGHLEKGLMPNAGGRPTYDN